MTRKIANSRRPEYRVWLQMRQRCSLKSAPNFKYYGGKGVKVCRRWDEGERGKTGFECFMEDMGERPDGLTLDRIDTGGDYAPGNCRWASRVAQANNKSCNVKVTAFGKTRTVAQWARLSGLSQGVIGDRLSRDWPPEKAVSSPLSRKWSRHAGKRAYKDKVKCEA